jgi:hypothetical protein
MSKKVDAWQAVIFQIGNILLTILAGFKAYETI